MLRIVLMLVLLSAKPASSMVMGTSASVEISHLLTVTQVQALNFGVVLKPSSGTNIIRIKPNGQYHSSTTGAVGQSQSRGRFKIVGEPGAVVQYTNLDLTSTVPGITFDRLYHASTQTIPNDGDRFFNVGARIYIDSSVTPGVYDNGELSYTIQAEYQ